jgi:hypothetical protein
MRSGRTQNILQFTGSLSAHRGTVCTRGKNLTQGVAWAQTAGTSSSGMSFAPQAHDFVMVRAVEPELRLCLSHSFFDGVTASNSIALQRSLPLKWKLAQYFYFC